MDERTLRKRLASKINVPDLTALGDNAQLPVSILHDLCHDQGEAALAFRAAWVLEYIAMYHPDRFVCVFDAFIARFPLQRNRSCQRHFTKILLEITQPKAPACYRQYLAKANRETLVETVFSWLIDTRTPVAVQANCMEILCYLSVEFDWIKEELVPQIRFLLRGGTAAVQSRGRKILRRLDPSEA